MILMISILPINIRYHSPLTVCYKLGGDAGSCWDARNYGELLHPKCWPRSQSKSQPNSWPKFCPIFWPGFQPQFWTKFVLLSLGKISTTAHYDGLVVHIYSLVSALFIKKCPKPSGPFIWFHFITPVGYLWHNPVVSFPSNPVLSLIIIWVVKSCCW